METLQSIAVLAGVVALGAIPWAWRKARQYDARRKCLTGREVVAYMLHAEHCRGNRVSLEAYERSADIRAPWLMEADRRMASWPNQ